MDQASPATPVQRTPQPLRPALLHQHPDSGEIHALSSNGHSVYVITLGDYPTCTCPAGQNGRRCYHVADALRRFPAFYSRPAAVIVPAFDPEPPTPAAPALHICGNCSLPVSDADGIPPLQTVADRPGCVPWWRCSDYAACVASSQRIRQAGAA